MDRSGAIAFVLASSLAFPAALAVPIARPAIGVPAPDAKFTAEILPAGTKLVVGSATTRNLIVAKSGKAETEAVSNGTESATANYTATVVQSERTIDRLKLDFGSCPFTTSVRLKNPPRELAIAHQSFEMYRKDGKNVFTGAKGAEVPEQDRLAVQSHFLPLIFELPLAHLLAGKNLKKGAQLDVPLESASALLAPYRTMLPGGKATLTLADEKVADAQECAVFTLAATLPLIGDASTGARVSIELTGELTVTKRQCLLLYAKCEGTCSFSDANGEAAGGEKKPPAKDEKAPRKGAFTKETWTYYAKFG